MIFFKLNDSNFAYFDAINIQQGVQYFASELCMDKTLMEAH